MGLGLWHPGGPGLTLPGDGHCQGREEGRFPRVPQDGPRQAARSQGTKVHIFRSPALRLQSGGRAVGRVIGCARGRPAPPGRGRVSDDLSPPVAVGKCQHSWSALWIPHPPRSPHSPAGRGGAGRRGSRLPGTGATPWSWGREEGGGAFGQLLGPPLAGLRAGRSSRARSCGWAFGAAAWELSKHLSSTH